MEEWRPSSELRRPLPARVINTAHLPQVWNQGDLGICGSFVPTYYVRNYYESKARGEGRWDPNNAADRKKLVSPMWTVLTSHHGGGTYGPWGGFMYEACETLCNRGYLTVDELPFEGTTPEGGFHFPSAAMQLKALKRRGGVPVAWSIVGDDGHYDNNSTMSIERLLPVAPSKQSNFTIRFKVAPPPAGDASCNYSIALYPTYRIYDKNDSYGIREHLAGGFSIQVPAVKQ